MYIRIFTVIVLIAVLYVINKPKPVTKLKHIPIEEIVSDEDLERLRPLTNEEFKKLQDQLKLELKKGTKLEPRFNEPEFIVWNKVTNRVNENSFYADIINHDNDPFLTHDRDTNAHETTHGINSDIRNKVGGRVNAFYVGNNKAVVIAEPNMKRGAALEFLPMTLRSTRFELYFITNKDWENEPLYIFDEWIAYVNGGKVSVEDAQHSGQKGNTDAVKGCLEFSIFATAIAMAVEKRDPEYWKSNKQFKAFLTWNLKNSYELFHKGKEYFPWDDQDILLEKLRMAPEAANMRQFLIANCEGIWLK